jgi:hypothetical protein
LEVIQPFQNGIQELLVWLAALGATKFEVLPVVRAQNTDEKVVQVPRNEWYIDVALLEPEKSIFHQETFKRG